MMSSHYFIKQLLAVLPAASKTLLPAAYRDLMTDENSALIDYYPEDFKTDLNGKQHEWEAVVLIPFIDEVLKYGFRFENEFNSFLCLFVLLRNYY